MNIKYAILGMLSQGSCSGYDLKKKIIDSSAMYWSGNNNQIYTTLVALHDEGMVDYQVQLTAELPARKIYSITATGFAELKDWLRTIPQLPELHNDFLIMIEWANLLDEQDLFQLIQGYEEEVRMKLIMEKEKARRSRLSLSGSPKRIFLSHMANQNIVMFFENELLWLQNLKEGLAAMRPTQKENHDELPGD